MSSSATVYRRCWPLLGTFVELSLRGAGAAAKQAAAVAALAAMQEVSALMSFHAPESDLSRLNRTPVGRWLRLSSPLIEVLRLALMLQERSGGVFNVAIGRPLVTWRLLPGKDRGCGWEHLTEPGFELRGDAARRLRPVQLDLGGLAKGYAVDRAVWAMQATNADLCGCLNAGGDLRVFGSGKQRIWIRSGLSEEPQLRSVSLQNEALATSTVRPAHGVSAYVQPQQATALVGTQTAVVRATTCVVADALTKVALLMPTTAGEAVAQAFGAEVSILP